MENVLFGYIVNDKVVGGEWMGERDWRMSRWEVPGFPCTTRMLG